MYYVDYLENPEYSMPVMKRLVPQDRYLQWVWNDLRTRNPNCTEAELYEIIFNSNVIDDAGMIQAYLDCEKEI